MKKQILFIALFVLAALASVTKSYGQTATHTSNPEAAPACANDALHPMAGKTYDYIVASNPAAGAQFQWWATIDPSFIAAGALNVVALGSPDVVPTTPAVYNSGTNTNGTLNISWGTDILANAMASHLPAPVPTFVVVHTTGTTCADNLKAFQIDPVNAFMVDIKNVNHTTLAPVTNYGDAESQCYDNVETATWTATGMTYDYGTNILYYEVVASNFTGTWTPTFTLSGLMGDQSAVIEWDYSTAFAAPVTVTSGTASGTAVTTNVTDTSNGVSIFVRVTISNHTWEGLTSGGDDISLGVTGTNSANLRDVLATDCSDATLASNTATQTLNERPTITETTEVGTFE